MHLAKTVALGAALAASVGAACWAQTQTPSEQIEPPLVLEQPPPEETADPDSPSLDVSGTVSFGLRYGFGDSLGLVQLAYSKGLQFNQLLALNLEGGVPVTWPLEGLFSISAQLNSQQADNLQSLAMKFTSEHWIMEFGDFVVGEDAPQFIVPDRKLKGFRVNGIWDTFSLTGAFARVEGIAETKTFKGNTSSDVVTFSPVQPKRPWLNQPYLRHIDGLAYYDLDVPFIDGFTKVMLNLHPGPALDTLFDSYGLAYLMPQVADENPFELEEGQYGIVRAGVQTHLVLMRDRFSLLRNQVRESIFEYNRENQLEGEDRKEYPFNEGTDLELGFLEQFQAQATLDVDEASLPLGGYQQRRFYFLGHREVVEDSLKVEVTVAGEFVDISDPLMLTFDAQLFAEQGVVELDFPPDFYENPDHRIRSSFSYISASGIYILGFSIVKGSEKVFLNGNQLQRDVDYTIDYETGALILFTPVNAEDILVIEYEVLRGGLGGFTEYQRNLSQLSFGLSPQPWLDLNVDLFQGADLGSNEDAVRLRTMPNTHTTLGLRTVADLGPLQARLVLGYNINAYPFDKNARLNLPNQINAIDHLDYGGKRFVLFAHQNGLTVYDGNRWTAYDTRSGLSGRSVSDIAMNEDWVALSTESGVTLIRLQGDDPFAINPNWHRFYQQDGLADNKTHAVTFDGVWLWVGTANGFTQVNADLNQQAYEAPENWNSYQQEQYPAMLDPAVTHLRVVDGLVYLGSPKGLQTFAPNAQRFDTDGALLGGTIHDLQVFGKTVYAASDWGLRSLEDGSGSGWTVADQAVYAAAADEHSVWYAPERGLRVIGVGRVPGELREQAIRALHLVQQALWVGPVSGPPPEYELTITRFDAQGVAAFASRTTDINGRDLTRFQSVPLEDHLDLGGLGELSLTYRIGELSLTGALETVSPDYTAIGSTGRSDYLRWRLRGDYALLGPLNVFAEHVADLRNARVTDNLGFSWSEGMQLNLNYSEERVAQRDEIQANLTVDFSNRFLEDALRLRLTLDNQGARSLRRSRLSQEFNLGGSVDFEVTNALSLNVDVRSALQLRSASGNESGLDLSDPRGAVDFRGGLSWQPQFGFGNLSLDYEHGQDVRLPEGGGSHEDELDAQIAWQSFQLGPVMLVPRSALRWEQRTPASANQVVSLSSNQSVQSRWEQLGVQLRWGLDQVFSSVSQTENIQSMLSVRIDYSGFDQIKPGLSLTRNENVLKHASRDDKVALSHQWSANLTWTPQPFIDAGLSLSANFMDSEEETSARYGIMANTGYRASEVLNFSFNFNSRWESGVRAKKPFEIFGWDTAVSGDWRFSEDWVAQFGGGLLFSTDEVETLNNYLSSYLSAQATMKF